MIEILKQIVARTREVRPLIHTITNSVTVNDCANIILAAYGAPTMAQDEREVEEITALSQALVLNLGALRAQEAMLLAGKKANALGHPVVMDPVAAGASFLRGETSRRLLHEVQMAVIRGNASGRSAGRAARPTPLNNAVGLWPSAPEHSLGVPP